LSRHKRDWEELAQVDPYWAILSDPARRFGKWDVDAFFRTGEAEFDRVMQNAERLDCPAGRKRALDFGCGLGRVTRAMSRYFDECVGLDISETMIANAKELNAACPRCKFVAASGEKLDLFPDSDFDLIYSNIVLQHLPSPELIERKIAEFLRVLKPGGLAVFQLLSFVPWRYRIQPTRRIYGLLRALGLRHDLLYNRLGLTPIRSNFLPEERVLELVANLNGKCLAIERTVVRETSVRSATYMVTK
jgi:SAM-dependent methyltransferase